MADIVGDLQTELLVLNGLEPHHRVLEIGCGALVAGRSLMTLLEPGHYAGIDPNVWLIEAAISGDPAVRELVNSKRPIFLFNEDFDGTAAGRFDYVLSHSILSHAAEWQLPLFMAAVKAALTEAGVALASIRFTDEAGQLQGDSHDREWVYPGNSFFSPETAAAAATSAGLRCEWVEDYRRMVTDRAPTNFHDWIRLTPA
jgi:cyclopropane fatty-acyl-phospholipid synthase-like methyltransferase